TFYCGALTIGEKCGQLHRRTDHGRGFFSWSAASVCRRLERKPVMCMRPKGDDVAGFSNWSKEIAAKNLHRHVTDEAGKIQLCRLRKAREIYYHQNDFVFVPPKKGEDLRIVRTDKFKRAARECLEIFPHGNDATRPPKQ